MSSSLRLGAALKQALARKGLRDQSDAIDGVELVVASSTASGVLNRHLIEALDVILIDDLVPDAAKIIQQLVDEPGTTTLLVLTDTPVPTARQFGLRSHQLINRTRGPEVDQIATRLRRLATPTPTATAPAARTEPSNFKRREILVIGCSTGGPEALPKVLTALPADFAVPIVIVQHMPPDFTRLLAQRLDRITPLTVREVTEPVKIRRGEIWIAPGDRHVVLTDTVGSLRLDDGPEVRNCRPSVDVLFKSAAATYGRRTVAAILTGMGDDGCAGAQALDQAGAYIIAQDEATSVVWGMPGSATRAGVVDAVVPLDRVAAEIAGQVRPSASIGA